MKYTYKNKEFDIEVCGREWGGAFGLFHVVNEQPYAMGFQPSFEKMKEKIRDTYDRYHTTVPDTDKGWIDLFRSCVIQDGYEDWYIDEELAMRLLKLYKEKTS